MTSVLFAALLQAATASAPSGPLTPDSVLAPPGGPRIVLLATPGSGLAALRLSVPVRETHGEGGWGRILQTLSAQRVGSLTRQIGARLEAVRTPSAIVYTVWGARTDLDYLALVLREVSSEPQSNDVLVNRARNTTRAELDRARETPPGQLEAGLRNLVAPDVPPLYGTAASLAAVTPAGLREFWSRTHARSEITVVVAADVPPEALLVALRDVGSPEAPRGRASPDAPAPAERAPRPQVIRNWFGQAHPVGPPGDPRAPVAAFLMSDRLGSRPVDGYEAEVELWEIGDRQALVVTGGAYARGVGPMRQRIQGLLAETSSGLTEAHVERAVDRFRQELLLGARSPEGLVAVVGRYMDAAGDPGAAARFLAALEGVDRDAMAAFLADVSSRPPHRFEVRP